VNDPELIATLRLAFVPGIGPRLRRALLDRFGSARATLCAAPSQWREVPGLGPNVASRLAAAGEIDIEAEIEHCQAHDIGFLVDYQDGYPRLLKEIADPPSVLFHSGQLCPADSIAVAIVGTRHATRYGRRQAERLAGELARAGVTIVSGLARGIDSHAHRGALAAGGRTIAVLGSGLLNLYPRENKELAAAIKDHGAILSEFPPRSPPLKGHFPRRNRLITGLTLGVIIVEAGQRSGALISARLAAEQGRDVFAVPGPVDSRASRGCHQLLRDGAILVETADDVFEHLGPLVAPTTSGDGQVVRRPSELTLNDQEKTVLAAIDGGPTPIDQIVDTSGLPVHRVLATISVLEMRRLVRRVSGQLVERV
jgi:DNA processing protein